MSEDPLLKPYQIKNLEIRNRLMTSAHEPSYAENGIPKDRYRYILYTDIDHRSLSGTHSRFYSLHSTRAAPIAARTTCETRE